MISLLRGMIAAIAFGCSTFAVVADQRPVVVELFTSQGCSSCPPADELLREIGQRDDVIALALHVDYWDYIGWKDRFGNPAHAKRQRAYAAAGKRNSVYTPEMVINGQTAIVGARPMKLADAIMKYAAMPAMARLSTQRSGQEIAIELAPVSELSGEFTVQMVSVTLEEKQKITRGENRGRTIIYSNIARDWSKLGRWDGRGALSLTATAPKGVPCVVLVQRAGSGEIVAAARVE